MHEIPGVAHGTADPAGGGVGVLATQRLTHFLSTVADRPDGPTAQRAAVECAARAVGADLGVLLVGGDHVAAGYGLDAGRAPLGALAAVVSGRRTTLDVDGRVHAATHAPVGGAAPGALVVARTGPPFDPEEVCLLRGMARVLELSLQALQAAGDPAAGGRGRLHDRLAPIQRAIARRAPLQEILDAVTAGAADLVGVEVGALCLLDADDRGRGSMVAGTGLPPRLLDRLHGLPLPSAGVTGLAVLGDELVGVEDYASSPIAIPDVVHAGLTAAMAVPVHEDGVVVGALSVGTRRAGHTWDRAARETLTAFAEHVSLAVTDARTLEAMNAAFHDPLTGLAGRALFTTRLEGAFVPGAGVAVLFVDVDRFKVVNDSLGHAAGDLLLRRVAGRLRDCLGPGDTAARIGGDEFAVLLPGASGLADATGVAGRIVAALRRPFDLDGREAYVSASVGVAYGPPGSADAQDLMVSADLAVYQAKKRGKDRYEVFEPGMRAAFQASLALEADLRRAVVRQEFELRYQPIVKLRTGEITGVEALVRWRHPERGVVGPREFIPLAEETGMIVPIGEWVLREACRQVAEWNRRRGRPLTVSVNLSAVQLDQGTLPRVVGDALADSGLPAAALVVELTESLLVDHRPATLRQLQETRALGVRLAIDDFGTGYSSLAYLRRFPVDIIKIDKSFVDDVGDEPAAAALTLGIIQLGRALRLSTIAEGIEDAGQLTELTDGDCELGQGYYFAEPLTGTDLSARLFGPAA